MALLPAAEHFGSDVILKFSPLGYVLSGAFGLSIILKGNPLDKGKQLKIGS